MSRKKRLVLNTVSSVVYKIITVVCAFVLPRLILSHFGSAVNGLSESISNFLGFISMLEMGVTSVIDANLYKPLATRDYDGVNNIFISSRSFFRKIAYVFVGYVIVLAFLYPFSVTNSFDYIYTVSLILIIAISTFSQYYFGISYRIVINADQRGYVVTIIQGITVLINTALSIVLMTFNFSIHVVKFAVSIVFLIQPVFFYLYAKKKYHLNGKKTISEEPIKQKWNGFAQHLAFIVSIKADIVILTLFSTLENVSIYGVYALVISGITTLFDAIYIGVSPMVGNMIAKGENEKLKSFFEVYDWLTHFLVTLLFTLCGILIVPFVQLYTSGISDANYSLPLFGVLLTIAYGLQVLRTPYKTVIHAAGHFKQTQTSAIIEMILNISFSVVMVFSFGLIGVAIGTIVAMLYRIIYFSWYLSKNILCRSMFLFLRSVAIDSLSVVLIVFPSFFLPNDIKSYLDWFVYALIVGAIGFVSTTVVNLLFNTKTIKAFYRFIRGK